MTPLHGDRERVALVVFYGAVLLIGYLVFRIAQPFLGPLGWAGVLAVCAHPLQARLERRLSPSGAALVTTLLVTIWLIVPAWLIGTVLVREGVQAVNAVQNAVENGPPERFLSIWGWLQGHLPFLETERLAASLGDIAKQVAGAVASGSGAVLGGVAVWLFQLVISLFALFFFLRDRHAIVRVLRWFLPFDETQRDRVLRQVEDLVFASVVAGLVIAALQGAIGGLTFWLLGIRAPVVWGTVMAFLSLLPMVGSWLVWGPVAVWLLLTGEVTRGLILIAVGAGLVGSIDNVLRPLLLSGRSAMNGLVTFVALLGGVAAFGFIGIVLGPVVVAVATALLNVYMRPATTVTIASPSGAASERAVADEPAIGAPGSAGPRHQST